MERLKEAEKSQEAANRMSLELVESEKAVVAAKLKELEEREEDFELLGSYVEERAIQVRKAEQEMEERRKELEAQEKDIEECFLRFRLREKLFHEQFKVKQSELQVRSSKFDGRENQFKEMESNYELRLRDKEKKLEQFKTLDQRIKAVELREKVLEQKHKEVESEGKKLAEWSKDLELKHSDLQVRSSELNVRANQLKEIESNHELRLRNKEKKLEEQFKKLDQRIKAAQLNEKLLEQKHKESESEDKKRVEWKKDLQLKLSELQGCLSDLGVREKQFAEQNSNNELRLREKEKKLEEQFKMLDEQIKAVELREKLLEQKHKEVESEANRLAEWKKDLSSSNDNEESALAPLIENKSAPAQCSGAQHSWADACGDCNQNHSTDPDPALVTSATLPVQQPEISNCPDQKPERALSDNQGCKSHLPITFGHSGAESVNVSSLFVPECLEKDDDRTLNSLSSKIQNEELYCYEVGLYLRLASDPVESVLRVVKDPSSFSWSWGNGQVKFASPEHGPLLMLDHMRRNPYYLSQEIGKKATSFAVDWKSKLVAAKQLKDDSVEIVSFLLFLAAYKLDSTIDLDDLFSLFRTSQWCINVTKLLRTLCFDNLMTRFIEYLMRNKRSRQALQCINWSSLLANSSPAKRLVSNYWVKRSKMLRDPKTKDDQIGEINKELHVWKALVKHVADQKLVERFRAYISFLETQKEKRIQAGKNCEGIARPLKEKRKLDSTPTHKSQDKRAKKRRRKTWSLSKNES